jgi:tRNA-binding EMAP/Myf-like protein
MAEWYAPEDLVGRKIVVGANLEPRRLHGHDSQGMLLAALASVGQILEAAQSVADVDRHELQATRSPRPIATVFAVKGFEQMSAGSADEHAASRRVQQTVPSESGS